MTGQSRARIEAHCRAAFASWDGYRGLGGVTRQHFTEEQREHWRGVFRPVTAQMEAGTNPAKAKETAA